MATGELLAFLDQDDLWYPRHLAALSPSFGSDPELGWAYSDFDEIDGDGRLITRQFIAAHQMNHPKTTLHQILGSDLMVLPSASVLRRSAYLAVGGFDVELSGYEDDELFLRMFRATVEVPFRLQVPDDVPHARCEFVPTQQLPAQPTDLSCQGRR